MARFVFDFAIPAMLFRAMATSDVFSNPPWALWGAFFPGALITYGLGVVIAISVFKRSFPGAVITGMGASYGNTVLLGIPITILVLGDAGLLPSLLIIAAHSLVLMSLSAVLLETGRTESPTIGQALGGALKRMATNPVIVGLVLGLIWNAASLPIPSIADAVLTFLKGAVVPCSLFALGASLARYGFKGRLLQSTVVTGLKLLVMPGLVWIGAELLELSPVWTAAAVLLAAQPTGINMFLFASRYETAEAIASTSILVGTIAAVLVMPVLIFLLSPRL